MARLREIAEKVRDCFQIPITKIRPGKNCRKDFEDVPDLAASLFAFGQLSPIEARLSEDGETAIIADGERRWRAAKYVNDHYDQWVKDGNKGIRFDTLSCYSEPANIKPIDRIFRQIEHNDTAKALTALERAAAYKEALLTGMTIVDIAKRVQKTAQHVADYIGMLEAPQELKEAVEKGQMSATAATKIRKAKPEKKAAAVEKAKKGEKVKVKDMVDSMPLGMAELNKAIKRADHYIYSSKKNTTEEARWQGVKWGLEYAAGKHDQNF
jgi:ParB-like chromosome segregation protein Spo0J